MHHRLLAMYLLPHTARLCTPGPQCPSEGVRCSWQPCSRHCLLVLIVSTAPELVLQPKYQLQPQLQTARMSQLSLQPLPSLHTSACMAAQEPSSLPRPGSCSC